jgi:hypothetical protein
MGAQDEHEGSRSATPVRMTSSSNTINEVVVIKDAVNAFRGRARVWTGIEEHMCLE